MQNKLIKFILLTAFACTHVSCSSILTDLGLTTEDDGRVGFDRDEDCRDLDEGCDEEMERALVAQGSTHRSPASERLPDRIRRAVENNDIVVGMTAKQVMDSWGAPTVREVAGSGELGHERWRYGSKTSERGERYLIFESGRVVGWHR